MKYLSRLNHVKHASIIIMIALLSVKGAHAETLTTYDAKWFARFAPTTASDILNAIPSFTVEAEGSKRGIGRTNENVLINGSPVKGKGASAQKLLQQIPASAVVKVIVGDAQNFDVTGVSGLIANIQLKQKRFEGAITWSPEDRPFSDARLNRGSINLSGRDGTLTYALGLINNATIEGDKITEKILNQNGQVTDLNDGFSTRNFQQPTLKFDIAKQLNEDYNIGLNFSVGTKTFDKDEFFNGLQIASNTSSAERRFFTATVDEERSFSETTLRLSKKNDYSSFDLVGFYRNDEKEVENRGVRLNALNNDVLSQNAFTLDTKNQEAILQGVYRLGDTSSFWEFSSELVFNSLDADGQFGSSLSEQPIALSLASGSTGRVEEERGQLLVSRRANLGKWTIDSTLGGEYSKLTVSELSEQNETSSRRFFRPKGAFSGSYPVNKDITFRAEIEREVAQLDFFDFLGNQDFSFNRESGSNRDLEPSQSWVISSELEHRFNPNSTYTISLSFTQEQDSIGDAIVDGQNAIANIGDATIWELKSDLSWRPSSKRFEQFQLNFSSSIKSSEVEDPLTGQNRAIPGLRKWFYLADLSYQLKKHPITLGAKMEHWRRNQNIQANEEFIEDAAEPFLEFYLKHSDFFGFNAYFAIVNVLDQEYELERTIFSGFRDDSPISSKQLRSSRYDTFVSVQLQKTF